MKTLKTFYIFKSVQDTRVIGTFFFIIIILQTFSLVLQIYYVFSIFLRISNRIYGVML